MIQITRPEHGIDDIQIDGHSLATDDGLRLGGTLETRAGGTHARP